METIHLISGSPRRQILLKQMGLPFTVYPVDTEEYMDPDMEPENLAISIAGEKLKAFLDTNPEDVKWAIAADTFIYLEGTTVGKPYDREGAYKELKRFSGKTHQVFTGISLYNKELNIIINDIDKTDVTFRELTENEIQWYLGTNEWKDVAGSYRIQGKGECLIQSINGSYSSVMGLPITLFYGMLKKLNYKFDKFPAGNC
ncbi:MAG: Maf family protein [Spirochaetaceae bacterium]|jgi:septum formation protein|nr:Maf family protein [Spirochaetaceae bacterium]